MPKEKRTPEEKYQYDLEYRNTKTTTISLVFNRTKPEDMELCEWIRNQPGSSTAYIKNLIRQDRKSRE